MGHGSLARFTSGAFVFLACGGDRSPASAPTHAEVATDAPWSPPPASDALGCFRDARVAADPARAIAACDERFFGRTWRQRCAEHDAGAHGCMEPAVIQAVIRSGFAIPQRCYEQGLGRDRNLAGKVVTKFVIDEEGLTRDVTDFGSEMADAEVSRCVRESFMVLRFPKPERGRVTVVYPIIFDLGD